MNQLNELKNLVLMYENVRHDDRMTKEDQRKGILELIENHLKNIHHGVSTTIDNVRIARKVDTISIILYDVIKFNETYAKQVRFYSQSVIIDGLKFEV